MNNLKPIYVNFKNVRIIRQKNNNLSVFNSIKDNNKDDFNKNINQKELKRILEDLEISFECFWKKCYQDDIFAKLASGRLSKNASRQCTKDEEEQIRTCNFITQICGVNIKNLSSTAIRPTKNGNIISKKEMKEKNITKDCCLKSFDGRITGKMDGYLSTKVSYGSGGHQDNVFEEMDELAYWWSKHKKDSCECLVLLIDTDLINKFECIRKKYDNYDNIKVFNHYEFQQYIISKYYNDSI